MCKNTLDRTELTGKSHSFSDGNFFSSKFRTSSTHLIKKVGSTIISTTVRNIN